MSTIDFADIKTKYPIEQVARVMLGLKLTAHNGQLRGACPITKSADTRSFVITPAKQVYYSFKDGKGGDSLRLVSLVRGCTVREAAEAIAQHFGSPTVPDRREVDHSQPPKGKRTGFDAETYAKGLDPAHEALQPLGVSEATYREWKAGYSAAGVLRGRLALPVTTPDGTVVAYVGRSLNDTPPLIAFHKEFDPAAYVFGADRVTEGELTVVRDVLDVLRASESGVDNCVAFLTETIGITQLEVLVALMHAKGVTSISLF